MYDLFSYAKHASSLNDPGAFIISKLKTLVENIQKGNPGYSIHNLIDMKRVFKKVEMIPDYMFSGESSKREIGRKEQIKFDFARYKNVRYSV